MRAIIELLLDFCAACVLYTTGSIFVLYLSSEALCDVHLTYMLTDLYSFHRK